ncbi:Golgi transport complex subunit 5-domain-containing protein [Gaertneriomyces semiglobifer]|nr:Golgi transport complex subunit 5-domain-containing protein [Gaertneriomyces semiglobifer]
MLSPRKTSLASPTTVNALVSLDDYKEFADEDVDFDPTQYANRILHAPSDRCDLPNALAKLNFGIEHLNKQIQEQVTVHYEDLLQQIGNLSNVNEHLEKTRQDVSHLNSSFDRLRNKVLVPYEQIRAAIVQLERIQETTETIRRVRRFLDIIRRLDGDPVGEHQLTKSALDINELDAILRDKSLKGIDVVEAERAYVTEVAARIEKQGDSLLQSGLSSQNQRDIACSLQVFHNLGILSSRMEKVIATILEVIRTEIQGALDVVKLNRELKDNANPRRATFAGDPAYNGLWKRLEHLWDVTVYDSAIQIYHLSRVLTRSRDPVTHTLFVEMLTAEMKKDVRGFFWNKLCACLGDELRLATRASPNLNTILQIEYPRVLRLVHNLFARLSVITGEDYNDGEQQPDNRSILRVLAPLETGYLHASLTRLMEPVNAALPDRPSLVARPVPNKEDVDKIVRVISSELEVARFDAHLLKAVARHAIRAVKMYGIRCEQLHAADSNIHLNGSGPATQGQMVVIELINCMWLLQESLWKLYEDFEGSSIQESLSESVDHVSTLLQNVVEQFYSRIARELEGVFIKMHKEDLLRSAGGATMEPSTNQYVLEFTNKVRWLHRELLAKVQCGDDSRDWIRSLGEKLINFFLRHASMIRPSNEATGRVLAGDMSQIEFVFSQWFAAVGLKLERDLEDCYKALRAFRHLPFLDVNQVIELFQKRTLSQTVVLHHLLARAHPYIPFPTVSYGWTETQYSDWLDSHTEQEAAQILRRCIDSYAQDAGRRGVRELRPEYAAALKVLDRDGAGPPVRST